MLHLPIGLYPNPLENKLTVTVSLVLETNVHYTLLTMPGRLCNNNQETGSKKEMQ